MPRDDACHDFCEERLGFDDAERSTFIITPPLAAQR
jgi:hypothetical protein